jgi:histidinol-phosphatase (PHP family)
MANSLRPSDEVSRWGGIVALPGDSHVHSEWSYDARSGSMELSCARALDLGLAAIAFTEHLDHTMWTVPVEFIDPDDPFVDPDGLVTPPELDVPGYLAAIERCRDRFPGLRILSGIEIGEHHWHAAAIGKVLAAGRFDRVLGSQHCLPDGDGFAEPPGLFQHQNAAEVARQYLAEVARLIANSDSFSVLAHIDYPVRYWPASAGPFDPNAFDEDFRHALRALADSGRTLEVNTTVPLCPEVVRWWHEEGGSTITFGSDAHDPTAVARGFAGAATMVEAIGFRPGRHPHDFWTRTRPLGSALP